MSVPPCARFASEAPVTGGHTDSWNTPAKHECMCYWWKMRVIVAEAFRQSSSSADVVTLLLRQRYAARDTGSAAGSWRQRRQRGAGKAGRGADFRVPCPRQGCKGNLPYLWRNATCR